MQVDRSIDVLIITALREEYEQVLEVSEGALPGSQWETRPGPLGHEIAFRVFKSVQLGKHLDVAVTWAADMGGVATALEAEGLIAEYAPRCLAMCGVCAGRRGAVNIGDVIIADRVWMYDGGKLVIEIDANGSREERIQGNVQTYNLRPDWKKAAEAFVISDKTVTQWGSRPRPTDMQANWLLERLHKGENPQKHPDKPTQVPNWKQVIRILWEKGWLEDGTLDLTNIGQKHITRLLLEHDDELPTLSPFRVHVGPIGSGNKVIQDSKIFDLLSENMRKVLGLEMEAMAIGAVADAHREKVPYMIVMKGVMDHADEWKNDSAKTFAARASAECLIAFLRKHLPPAEDRENILFRKWDRAAATKCVIEQLRNFGNAAEYELGLETDESDEVSHELLDFYYLKYLERDAYIAIGVTRTVPPAEYHAAAPALSFVEFIETPRGWQLGTVHPNALHAGSWGGPPGKIYAMEIGYNMFAIAIESSYMGQGIIEGHTSMHTMVTGEFKEVFSMGTFVDDSGSSFRSTENWRTDIKVVREGTSFYDLIVTRTGVREGKKINETERYRFDGRRYERADLYR